MKKLLLSLLAGLMLTGGLAHAQVTTNYWKLLNGVLQPVNSSWTVNTGSGGATSTFGFITATTTNATSTFAGNVQVSGDLRVLGNFYAPVSIVSAGNITPSANNTYTLGTNALKWASVFSTNLYATSSVITTGSSTAYTATTFYCTTCIISNASTTNETISGTLYMSALTTGSIPFINGSKNLTQQNSNLFWDSTNFRMGINTASPAVSLDVATGTIAVREYDWGTATSTTMSVDWKRANTQKMRISTAGVTITHVNATTTVGVKLTLVVCNAPSGTAGTITWGNPIYWSGGTAPTQTTTANKCDVYSFMSSSATSTPVIFGSASTGF